MVVKKSTGVDCLPAHWDFKYFLQLAGDVSCMPNPSLGSLAPQMSLGMQSGPKRRSIWMLDVESTDSVLQQPLFPSVLKSALAAISLCTAVLQMSWNVTSPFTESSVLLINV